MKIDWIKRAEWITAIALSLMVLFLLIVRATHAGALWRDECNSLQLARMPTFANVRENYKFESCPLLLFGTLRAYTDVFGTSDTSLRCFGLAVGITLVGVAWLNSRLISSEVPLVFLALAGLNTTFLTWGTTSRGYGLGSALVTLAFGLTAKLLFQPKSEWLAAMCLACLASVQLLFFNIALVAALAAGAVVACLFRRRINLALAILGIAALCAISYIPYLRMYLGIDWNIVVKTPLSFAQFWHGLNVACGAPISIVPAVWHTVFLGSFIAAAWRLKIIWRANPFPESDLLLLGLVTSLVAIPAHYAFLYLIVYSPQPRYYLAFLCLIAAFVDLIVANLSRFRSIRLARLAFVMLILIALPVAAWPKIIERQTNIDTVAQKLQKDAGPNDLIVVDPWSFGVSFNWYYHGTTPWLTVPVMNEHRIHRYDLLKAKMMASFPLDDLEHEVSATLRSGNRIWFVGGIKMPHAGEVPLFPLPAPDPKFGWAMMIYRSAWSQQLAEFIRQHTLRVKVVLRPQATVNKEENVPLWAAEGWRD